MKLRIKNPHKVINSTISQKISWGHWFVLFNILITIILGSQYVRIADWPQTLLGRFYAIVSCIGQFSFLCFALYLITLFPLSFIIRSARFFRILSSIVATVGIIILLIDIEIFFRFRMHLNVPIWGIFTTVDKGQMFRSWYNLFILLPLIFLLEYFTASWIWKKLRRLKQWRNYVKPLVELFIVCFLSFHFIHIWADAHFYRSITMQRSSLPLSYPMTARHLLKKYGLMISGSDDERVNQNRTFPMIVQYPLGVISYKKGTKPYNLLLITIDRLAPNSLNEMPYLWRFANQHLYFNEHYSASNIVNLSLFSLFYGIDSNYYESVMAFAIKSVFLDTLAKQHYNLAFFSADAFKAPVYQRALLSDFSLPAPKNQTNEETTTGWLTWLNDLKMSDNRASWFSFVNYHIFDKNTFIGKNILSLQAYKRNIKNIDRQIEKLIKQLQSNNLLKETVIVVTANSGINLSADRIGLTDSVDHFDRSLFRVPLVIAWPNTLAKQIKLPTNHTDIMRTLMENMLHVSTPPSEYSQGLNLFKLPENRQWVLAADKQNIIAFYGDRSIVLNRTGHYEVYDLANHRLFNEKLNLAMFLELLTNNRRFMVLN